MGIDSSSAHPSASASVIIFRPPSLPFESYITVSEEEQASILSQNLLPWRARASSLPNKIGDQLIDNAHAECFALILLEEWLPLHLPILLIMDSEAERDRYLHLQTMQHTIKLILVATYGQRTVYALGVWDTNSRMRDTNSPM